MDALAIRLLLVVGFVAYMAAVYLLIHIVVARVVRNPASPVLWFFSVVTRPLTSPLRGFLPAGASDARLRWMALGLYAVIWLAIKVALAQLHGAAPR